MGDVIDIEDGRKLSPAQKGVVTRKRRRAEEAKLESDIRSAVQKIVQDAGIYLPEFDLAVSGLLSNLHRSVFEVLWVDRRAKELVERYNYPIEQAFSFARREREGWKS